MDSSATRWMLIMLAVSMVVIFFLPQFNQCNANQAQEAEIQKALEEAAPKVSEETYRSADELFEATGIRLNAPTGVGSAVYTSVTIEGDTPIAQMAFNTDALGCTYRAKKSDELVDLSDYVDSGIKWSSTEDVDINGQTWEVSLVDDKGRALRYDKDGKISYSFTAEGPGLTMRKIQAILGAM